MESCNPTYLVLCAQLAEAKRELTIRRRLYPKWVANGQLLPALAEERLALQEGIVATVRRAFEAASPQPSLFSEEHRG